MTPAPINLAVNSTSQEYAQAQYTNCNGVYSYSYVTATWSSQATSVATVSSSGLVTGKGGGSTTISATATCNTYTYNPSFGCQATPVTRTGSATCNVVALSSVSCSNLHLALGTGSPGAPSGTNTGTCSATGSPSGGAYSWTQNGSTLSLSNTSSATVSYSSANPSSSMGDTTLTVTYTLYGKAPTASSPGITVHKPTSLRVAQDTTYDGTTTANVNCAGTAPCSDAYGSCPCTMDPYNFCSQTGPRYIRVYDVQDQLTPANDFDSVGISSTNNVESFTSISSTCCAATFTPGTPANTSQFGDRFILLNTCCFSGQPGCQATITQVITVNGYPVRTNTITQTCTIAIVTP